MPGRPRRTTYPRRRISGRRRPAWSELTNNALIVAANGFTNIDVLGDFDVAGGLHYGYTVVRTIVEIHVQNWAAVGDRLVWGLLVGRLQDVGTAAPAYNLADTDGLSWAFHEQLYPRFDGAAVRVADVYHYDTRSMRRIRNENETYLFCLANHSAAGKTFDVFIRTCVALP